MTSLRIGHLSTFYHTAVLLMADAETPRRLGVAVDWRLFGTGPAIVAAFEKGELDLAYIGLPPAIIGMERGVPIICVAGGHMEGTVLSAGPGWRGYPHEDRLDEIFGQFRGHAIGVPGRGSIHDVILREYLERFGLAGAVQVANFPWADHVLEAVVRREVTAAMGTPALAVAVRRYAGGDILYPAAMTWPHNPSYGILAEKGLLARAPELLKGFLAVHEQATSFLRERPEEAAQAISDYVGFVDAEFVRDVLLVSPRYCGQITDQYVACTMDFVRTMAERGYIPRTLSEDEIFDRAPMRVVHPGGDHYGLPVPD